MIIYRDQRCQADSHRLISELRSTVARSAPSHETAVGILIEAGIIESAVADAVFPRADGIDPLTEQFRRTSVTAGHVLWHTWHDAREEALASWQLLRARLNEIELQQLPHTVETTEPEGYAHYGVYPETYLAAAKCAFGTLGAGRMVCLGIRSIGCSLSAVVAAALEEMGCPVDTYTLRPQGHPFSRSPCLTPELVERLAGARDAHFLLIDEGPGLSGSSLGGTAALLHRLGVADDHVHLFPSWRSDGRHLRSAVAREHWPRHRQFTCSFEEVWLRPGRLESEFPGNLRDLSAGAWRQQLLPDATEYPAVQPQHERRKYLLTLSSPPNSAAGLLTFAGLHAGAERKIRRLERVADAGFTPAPEKAASGFVLRRFIPGTPGRRSRATPQLLETVASYLAHLYREHEAGLSTGDAILREMVQVNVAEGLRDSTLERELGHLPRGSWTDRPVALDGRMLAHEWIETAAGYTKVDAMDHHDDHFFPGCQDIAWDLAGGSIELGLTGPDQRHLLGRYRSLSGDQAIAGRLHPYAVAYLAFRLGYTTLASEALGRSEDGLRFSAERQRYHDLLRRELSVPGGIWDG
jgi:hypothetical protein